MGSPLNDPTGVSCAANDEYLLEYRYQATSDKFEFERRHKCHLEVFRWNGLPPVPVPEQGENN